MSRTEKPAIEWNTKDLPVDRISYILGFSIESLQKMTVGQAEVGAARAWDCNEREYFAAYASLARILKH